MATFYPAISNDFHGSDGESIVYKARQKLDGAYTIFHSFRWLGAAGQRRSEEEADFIILHPRYGILSIEVKAGGIDCRDGNWIQINRRDKSEKVIDPLGQAAQSQYYLQSLLRQKFSPNFVLVGRAAWFPSVTVPKNCPPPRSRS